MKYNIPSPLNGVHSNLSEGVIIPHGIYDLGNNQAYLNIGTSKETSEFVCDSLYHWWIMYGQFHWRGADMLLLLVDAGGSNAYRSHLFKADLQHLANRIGITIRVAHYPPYCSKWNPVEPRVFPHLTRTFQGVVFDNHETFKALAETTSTTTGLERQAHIIDQTYHTGRKLSAGEYEAINVFADITIPDLNYYVMPQIQL